LKKNYCHHNQTEDFQNIGYTVAWHLFYTQCLCLADSQPHLLLDLNPNLRGVTQQTDLFHLRDTLFSIDTAHVSSTPAHLGFAQTAAKTHKIDDNTNSAREAILICYQEMHVSAYSYNEIKWHL